MCNPVLKMEVISSCCAVAQDLPALSADIRGTLLVAQLVEVLHYKPEGRGFVSDGVIGICH
jgi:hypothetical protein